MDARPILEALVATGALIVLGYALRRAFTQPFWRGLESMSYHLLLPSLLVGQLATADLTGPDVRSMVAVLAGSSLLVAAVALGCRRLIGPDGPAFTSTFQSGVRFNTYVGFFVATSIYGAGGATLAALASAVLVPLANLTSTLVLVRYGDRGDGAGPRPGFGSTVRELGRNPLVLACLIGFAANLTGHALPRSAGAALSEPLTVLGRLLDLLGSAAMPLGLLCVGAGIGAWRVLGSGLRYAVWASVLRFAVVPAITVGLCLATGLSGPAAVVAVLFQALPTASSAYVLARALGGDAPLMAAIIAQQTVFACVAMPAWLLLAATL